MQDRPSRAAPSGSETLAGLAARSAAPVEIVDAWLAQLPDPDGLARRSSDLLDVYRALGTAVIRLALGPAAPAAFARDELAPEGLPGVDRLLALVTAANRKSGMTVSQTLEDFGRLAPSALAWLRATHEGATHETRDVLAVAESVVEFVSRALQRLARLMEATAARAHREQREALASMTDVLSHELRNRLGAARTASEMLLNPDVDLSDQHLTRAVELVRMSVDDALRTVEDVRGLAATRAEVERRTVRPTELPGLVRAVVNELLPAAHNAGVEVVVADDIVPCRVDASRLRLILFNLIQNGIKYRDPDEASARVWVETDLRQDGRVAVRVRDNGVGIPADEIDDVFLYRVRGARADDTVGSGLGLAIVSEAADQIEGEISVRSRVAEGTTFTLIFPPLGPSETTE